MTWIVVALVLWGALLVAHLLELRRLGLARAEQRALDRTQVGECLENIDRLIDLRDHAVRLGREPAATTAFD